MNDGRAPVVSVIAPCLNEEGNVGVLVARTLAAFETLPVPAELILIDDGSTDGTWAAMLAEMATSDRVHAVRHDANRGIVNGWVSGLAAARGELVCLIDADLQNRPEDIPRLYEAYRAQAPDMVQGVRHPKEGMSRATFSRGLNVLLNVSFGMSLRDNKSGFVLCSRDTLRDMLQDRHGYRYFQSFIGVAAGVRKLRVVEVDTEFDARHAGKSFLSDFPLAVSLRICSELLRYRLSTLRRR